MWLKVILSTIVIRLMLLAIAVRADVTLLQTQKCQYHCLHACQSVGYMKYDTKMCKKAFKHRIFIAKSFWIVKNKKSFQKLDNFSLAGLQDFGIQIHNCEGTVKSRILRVASLFQLSQNLVLLVS